MAALWKKLPAVHSSKGLVTRNGGPLNFRDVVSVSRRSRDPLRPRSRLERIGKRLGLGIETEIWSRYLGISESWYRSRTVRPRAHPC